MVTVNEQTVVLQTTLVLTPEATARIDVQGVPGMAVKIRLGARGVMPARAEDLEQSISGGEFSFEFPFLENKFTLNADYGLTYSNENFSLLIAGHGVGSVSVVHLQIQRT